MKVRALALGVAIVAIGVAVVALRPAPTPGPFARDFEAYWSAGRAQNAARLPYSRAIWTYERTVPGVNASREEFLPFVGPPQTLALWSLAARLPYARAAALWWCVLALALAAAAIVTVRTAKARAAFSAIAAIALAVAFGPMTSDLALGQVALLAFAAATSLAALANVAARAAGGAASVALAFLASLQPNAALGLVSQLGRNRTTLALAAGALLAYLAGAAMQGLAWPIAYVATLAAHQRAERFSGIQITPLAIAHGFGMPDAIAVAVAVFIASCAVATGAWLWRNVDGRFARFAALSPLAPFVATFFHEHDLIVAYAAAAWCAVRARGRARTLALAGTLLVAIDWLGLAQRPSGVWQSALLAIAALAAFTALGEPGDLRAQLVPTAFVAALFAGATIIAAWHPMPVWPDALGSFQAPAASDAAHVWHVEQLESGLLITQRTWAELRTLSLAGCVLLAIATSLSTRRNSFAQEVPQFAGTGLTSSQPL